MSNKYDDLVSIVVPTYNDSAYLKEAIKDLLNQTHKNLEIIIVNDGSTDNTADILTDLSNKYKNIRIINKHNGGTGSALNVGFKEIKGKYCTWVSSDDRKNYNMIERLLSALKDNNVEYAVSAYFSKGIGKIFRAYKPSPPVEKYIFDLNRKEYIYNNALFDDETSGKTFVLSSAEWLKINLYCCHSGVNYMFTKRLKEECGDFICIPGEDYYMSVLMGSKSSVAYIDEALGTHNNPPDSLSMMGESIVREANKKTQQFIMNYFKGKN
jgi:glycosyltransferase involved in cell wall biosynthesis